MRREKGSCLGTLCFHLPPPNHSCQKVKKISGDKTGCDSMKFLKYFHLLLPSFLIHQLLSRVRWQWVSEGVSESGGLHRGICSPFWCRLSGVIWAQQVLRMNETGLMRTSGRNHLLMLPLVGKSIMSFSCSFYLTYNSVALSDIF